MKTRNKKAEEIQKEEDANELAESNEGLLKSFPLTTTLNTFGARYTIDPAMALPEFTNSFGTAYEAIDKKNPELKENYIFVAESNMPQRLDVLNVLKDHNINNHIKPIAAEVLPVGDINKYCLCILMKKPKGTSLKNYMLNRGPLSEQFIFDFILPKMVNFLSFYEQYNICHGNINIDNIYIDENNEITVGDAVRESCGFSQNALYEPMERMQLMPIGKGRGDISVDYYALGPLFVFLLKGTNVLTTVSEAEALTYRLNYGSYDLFSRETNISTNFRNLLKGLLCDRKHDRWTTNKVIDWIKGKKYNFPNLLLHKKATRPFFFNDINYQNAGILSYGFWKEWEAAKRALKEGKIVKWVENGLSNADSADKLNYTIKISNSNTFITIEDDELVARSILILDSDSGIKFKELCFQPDSLPSILMYAFNKSNQEIFNLLEKVILSSLIHVYLEVKPSNIKSQDTLILMDVDKAKTNIRRRDMGFGLERILYDLNPYIICLSPSVINYYCHTVLRLLITLNEIAKDQELKLVDRHIAGFICHKLNVKKELRLQKIAKFPEVESNRYVRTLLVLAMAQKDIKAPELKHIAKRFNESLDSVIVLLKSKTLKKELSNKLSKASETGILDDLLNEISDSIILLKDRKGFDLAQRRYNQLENYIKSAINTRRVYEQGYYYGLRICMVASYVISGIGIFLILSQTVFVH